MMVSAIGGFPEGQAEALRLRLPQLLWKVHTTRGVCVPGVFSLTDDERSRS